MKKSFKFAALSFSIVSILTLTACSNNQSQKQSSESTHPVAEKVESSKTYHHVTPQKSALTNKDTYEQTTVSSSNQATPVKPVPSKDTSNTSATTPASAGSSVTQPKPVEYQYVNTPQDAVSLYQHYLGISGPDAYTAQAIDGGFYVKPNEAAYGHLPFIIKYNGDMYSSDGSTKLASFAELAAPYAGQPESGWHGF